MFGDKKKIEQLQQQYAFLSTQFDSLQQDYIKLSSILSELKNKAEVQAQENLDKSIKEDTLSKFKDKDGMYNYTLYKQRKMGLGGLVDEETK